MIAHGRGRDGSIAVLARWRAAETDDIAVRVFNIEVLRTPRRRLKRLEDLHAVGDTLFVERLDALDTRRRIEVLVFQAMLPLGRILGRFLQMQFQSIQAPDSVEPAPRLTELETQPLVVLDGSLKVVNEELRGERGNTRPGLV